MGMYTELVLNVKLVSPPEEVRQALRNMDLNFLDQEKVTWPDHEFFKKPRRYAVGHCSSYYFTPASFYKFKEDDVLKHYACLMLRCDLKNYDDEIESFLEWIAPYCSGDHAGHKRYEETEAPTLIYFKNGKVVYVKTTAPVDEEKPDDHRA